MHERLVALDQLLSFNSQITAMSKELKKYLFVVSALCMFGGFFYLWRTRRIENAYSAVILAVISQLAIYLLTFAKEVIEEIKKRLVPRIADSTITSVSKLVNESSFRRDYNKCILRRYDLFNVKGLSNINALKFEHIFVELCIDDSTPTELLTFQQPRVIELRGNHQIWDFLKVYQAKKFDGIALVVIGAPGSGKTSLLQNIAFTFAANKHNEHNIHDYIPIFLFLREHIDSILEKKPLHQIVQEYFCDDKKFTNLNPPANWFQNKLKKGRCLVLLDGLDEIADVEKRREISEWVDLQVSEYGSCRFILTSRPQGYLTASLGRARLLKVMPFNDAQVQRFIKNWYLAHEWMKVEREVDEVAEQRAMENAGDLINILRVTPTLKELTVNPLLLTMIAIVHVHHGALPGSRTELYRELCTALLEGWEKAKNKADGLKIEQKLAVLRPLAAYMMKEKKTKILYKEMRPVISRPLSHVGVDSNAIESFLDELELRSGLLMKTETEEWRFVHLSFQEYLAAVHWMKQKNVNQEWLNLVGDGWWYETLRFYAAQADATPLIKACKRVGTPQSLTLVTAILRDDPSAIGPIT
jgi:predicted NACHT family NTPase